MPQSETKPSPEKVADRLVERFMPDKPAEQQAVARASIMSAIRRSRRKEAACEPIMRRREKEAYERGYQQGWEDRADGEQYG